MHCVHLVSCVQFLKNVQAAGDTSGTAVTEYLRCHSFRYFACHHGRRQGETTVRLNDLP